MPEDCEANVLCHITNIKTDIAKLYGRTDDINTILQECCSGESPGTPGSSDLCEEKVCVTNEEELRAAVAAGEQILVVGEITLTSELEFSIPGTQLWGKNGSTGERAKITRQSTSFSEQNIFYVRTSRVEFHDLEITANNPLGDIGWNTTTGNPDYNPISGYPMLGGQQLDYAIRVTPGNAESAKDVSDLVVEGCFIHHVSVGIYLSGNSDAIYADRWRIIGNRIESFNYYGILMYWCTRNIRILNNIIYGRRKSEQHPGQPAGINETHTVPGNGIQVCNFVQRCLIMGNEVAEVDRFGIEVVNTTVGAPMSNDSCIIVGNQVHDLITPSGKAVIFLSMGITTHCGGNGIIIGWNHVRNTTYYAIEIFNDINSKAARHLVIGNDISNIIGAINGYSTWAIAVNSCVGALITGNIINKVEMPASAAVNSVGIIVIGGPALGHDNVAAFDGVTISNNQLIDAGNLQIVMGANIKPGNTVPDQRRAGTIINNVIRFTKNRQVRPGVVSEAAIMVSYCGTSCVVRDNICYHPTDLPLNGTAPFEFPTGFGLFNTGTVYCGDATHMPVVGAEFAITSIEGSNLLIPTDPSGPMN